MPELERFFSVHRNDDDKVAWAYVGMETVPGHVWKKPIKWIAYSSEDRQRPQTLKKTPQTPPDIRTWVSFEDIPSMWYHPWTHWNMPNGRCHCGSFECTYLGMAAEVLPSEADARLKYVKKHKEQRVKNRDYQRDRNARIKAAKEAND